MIRITQIRLPADHTGEQLEQKIRKRLRLPAGIPFHWQIRKRSLDARKKPDLSYVYTVDVTAEQEASLLRACRDDKISLVSEEPYGIADIMAQAGHPKSAPTRRPVIAGAGPAGLFCAYALGLSGYAPVVVERGKTVEERTADVERFFQTGVLDPSSNVQFGEGGAGTFSDGKLNTLVKDPHGRNRFVLETFVKFGAPEEILYDAKPHIGTDVLTGVIRRMRNAMEETGVTFRFGTCLTEYRTEGGRLTAVGVERRGNADADHAGGTEWIETDLLVLAVGHSARDTFRMLSARGDLIMEAKPFAVGFRVEHPQAEINLTQYGERYAQRLPAAPYKVTARAKNGRGVYSFCMCPGGYVVNASSQEGYLAVNGMSYAGRGGANANSAIIVSVTPEDYGGSSALAGVQFQELLERRAFLLGEGRIPQQLFSDYCSDRPSHSCGSFESARCGAGVWGNLRGLLPAGIEEAFLDGMRRFGRTLPDFDRPDAILSGVESRTSSPVRILRDKRLMSPVYGIFPCGEGAGYAGGIMSAAMDGLKAAEAVIHTAEELSSTGRA